MSGSDPPAEGPQRYAAPRHRQFRPPKGGGRGHRELVDRVATVGIPAFAGLFGGLFLGPAGVLLGVVLGYIVARVVVGSGHLVERSQSGGTTPHKPDYSLPESLVMRGEFDRAIEKYEEHVWAAPEIPDPYVSIARLYRDKLERPREAEQWFLRARKEPKISSGLDLLITQELIELYLGRLEAPRKAIPELTHICNSHAGAPASQAAEQELQELRQMLAREAEGNGSVTRQ